MIIDNLHVFGARSGPTEADSPLIVDTNAVLPGTPTLQCFKTISRRHSQIIKSGGNFELPQFTPRHRSNTHKASDADTF